MEKTINIDGQDIRFVSNGATVFQYRNWFGRGLFQDENTLLEKASKNAMMEDDAIEILYMITYTLARQGNPEIGEFMDFISQFEIMSLIEIAPEIIKLLVSSKTPTVTAKKK